MSSEGSNATACASSIGPRPPSCTVVSSWPATTWAFVTTRPGPATHPEPLTPRPQAVPSTRTTEAPAASTSGSRAIAAVGGGTSASGPAMSGKGSNRARALRTEPDGGRTALSCWRISERWISLRSTRAPGVCSATAPAIHTMPSATAMLSAAPSSPSKIPNPGSRTSARSRMPSPSRPPASTAPPSSAPRRPKSGA